MVIYKIMQLRFFKFQNYKVFMYNYDWFSFKLYYNKMLGKVFILFV